jgi:hypothetical protein
MCLNQLFSDFASMWDGFGTQFGTFGHHVSDIGLCRHDIEVPRCTPLAPFGHTLEATSAILETCLKQMLKDHSF